jgi:hypothetical protein
LRQIIPMLCEKPQKVVAASHPETP